jgi:sulfur carrier protein
VIRVNGEPYAGAPGCSIAALLAAIEAPSRGVAVAVDAEVVPRGEWESFVVGDEADVEVLTAVQGG